MELKSKYRFNSGIKILSCLLNCGNKYLFFRSDYIGVVNFHLALTPLPFEPK